MPPLSIELANDYAARFYSEGGNVHEVASQYSRPEIIAFLRATAAQVQAEIAGMTPGQLAYRLPGAPTGPDESGDEAHFDTSQIVTHIVTGTAFHWWNITRGLRHDRPPMTRAPQGTETTGRKPSGMGTGGWSGVQVPELSRMLDETVEGFLHYVNQLPEEAFASATTSALIFKNLTPHDWLFVIATHIATHLAQIREMKAQPDFPVD